MATPPPPPPPQGRLQYVVQTLKPKSNVGKVAIYGAAAGGVLLVFYGVSKWLSQQSTSQLAASQCGQEYAYWANIYLTTYQQYIQQNPGGLTSAQQAELAAIQQNMESANQCLLQAAANDPNSWSKVAGVILDSVVGEAVGASIIGYTAYRAYLSWRAARSPTTTSEATDALKQTTAQDAADKGTITDTELSGLSDAATADAEGTLAQEQAFLSQVVADQVAQDIITQDVADAYLLFIDSADDAEIAEIAAIILA